MWFVKIVDRGYLPRDGATQFHPLLPALAVPFRFMSAISGLLVVASAASLLFVFMFYRLAALDIPNPETATKLMIAFPVSFILFAPYTESLWLLFAALGLWYARKQRWWMASASSALAVLARQQGLFLLAPLACELWVSGDRRWKSWASLVLIPLALIIWVGYRGIYLSDVHPDFSSVNALIYSTILTPNATQVVDSQAMLPPWEAISKAIAVTRHNASVGNIADLVFGAIFIALAAIAWKRMRLSYRVLTAILFAVAFAYHTGPVHPYMGLPRHLLLAFPVFIGAAPSLERVKEPFVGLSMLFFMGAILYYVLQGWVP
jgi:Gpi18-like mannosyltransferase